MEKLSLEKFQDLEINSLKSAMVFGGDRRVMSKGTTSDGECEVYTEDGFYDDDNNTLKDCDETSYQLKEVTCECYDPAAS